ncbi:helix-turn-helix domain-containing protein [Aurantiacibacter suaedae]|uniref:helix-turn-helix domain-containing protein n=1 Tax=Aurantiacibacter suaedae TaxID=2545755 RepID=UPI0010F6BCFE|nr:helix-turn-helix domain-containing protein [Aurantiacibacter suaedae]
MNTAYLLTVRETCDALRIGRTNVYRLISEGQLKVVKIGSATRITTASIRALVGADAGEAAND